MQVVIWVRDARETHDHNAICELQLSESRGPAQEADASRRCYLAAPKTTRFIHRDSPPKVVRPLCVIRTVARRVFVPSQIIAVA